MTEPQPSPPPATPPPPMQPPQSPELRRKEQKLEARRRLGANFVKAILNEPFKALPNLEPSDASLAGEEEEGASGDMRVWCNIPDPYTGDPVKIVLRSIVEPFWKSCIERLDFVHGRKRYRVCAVGTPGIGKTHTTPLLLRMLLLQRSTVVFIQRTRDLSSYYYEFIPTPHGEIAVNVYPESTKLEDIDNLDKTSTYYVVDPGKSKENCDPNEFFRARVIIISSPNEMHWGGNDFKKENRRQTGVFHFYPLWELTEVLRGLVHFYPSDLSPQELADILSPQQLAERYREVGGVPRHLFADMDVYERILIDQTLAVTKVSSEQAKMIMHGNMNIMGILDSESPKSVVIGIALAGKNNFTHEKAVPISTAVAEKVFSAHIREIWNDMVDNERPLVFESYLRTVLTKRGREITVRPIERGRRPSVPAPGEPAPDEPAPGQEPIMIGGYRSSQIVPKGQRISIAARDHPEANILIYSSDPNYELIDFVCRDNAGNILAFQATTGRTHTASARLIKKLEHDVEQGKELMLFYLHAVRPGMRFATRPATPVTDFCQIYYVPIPMPNQDTPV